MAIVALMAMVGLNSCSQNQDHDYIKVDHSKDIIGMWTCLDEDFAQAFVFNADGTVVTTGVKDGEYWENVEATWRVVNNKLILSYDKNVAEFLFEMIPGKLLSIVEVESGERYTFEYCANDLSDEVVGMWVCNEGSSAVDTGIAIQTFSDGGEVSLTTGASVTTNMPVVNKMAEYKVIGDLMIRIIPKEGVALGVNPYLVTRLIYAPKGTVLGDMMYMTEYVSVGGELKSITSPWLRIKQYLDLDNKNYGYRSIYVTNVKGADVEFEFGGQTLNFSTLDGSIMDKFMKNILFNVSFPAANTISYNCYYNGNSVSVYAPIKVEGNKITIKMSENNPVYKDVVVYTFQDQDNTQMHWYMPTSSFENFFGNTSVAVMLGHGQLDINDAEAIAGIYQTIADAVESINLSLVMTKGTK